MRLSPRSPVPRSPRMELAIARACFRDRGRSSIRTWSRPSKRVGSSLQRPGRAAARTQIGWAVSAGREGGRATRGSRRRSIAHPRGRWRPGFGSRVARVMSVRTSHKASRAPPASSMWGNGSLAMSRARRSREASRAGDGGARRARASVATSASLSAAPRPTSVSPRAMSPTAPRAWPFENDSLRVRTTRGAARMTDHA